MDGEPRPRAAEGRVHSGAAALLGQLRRADHRADRRVEGSIPGPRAAGAARARRLDSLPGAMSPDHHVWLLTGAVLGVLVVASITGRVLRITVARGAPHPVIDNLVARVKAWWLMVILIGLALLAGKSGVIVLFAFVSFAALREYVSITPTRRGDHWVLLLCFFLVVPFQYLLIWLDWYGFYSIFIPVYCFLELPMVAVLRGEVRNFLQRSSTLQWGLMICVYSISHVPALLTLDIPGYEGRNAFLLVFLILIVQSSDVLQYVWGKLLGKTKIAPEVSPSKTVAGFVGGAASAIALGAGLWWITPFNF